MTAAARAARLDVPCRRSRIRPPGRRASLERARRSCRRSRARRIGALRACARPLSLDGRPLIGRVPGIDGPVDRRRSRPVGHLDRAGGRAAARRAAWRRDAAPPGRARPGRFGPGRWPGRAGVSASCRGSNRKNVSWAQRSRSAAQRSTSEVDRRPTRSTVVDAGRSGSAGHGRSVAVAAARRRARGATRSMRAAAA